MKKSDDWANPKVSVVIPVFNGEKYIKQAIDSAIEQTYTNVEILIVDDGSTDLTEEIVKSYGDKVRYIKKDNGGVSSALNVALKEMSGEYFSWLSHDDMYEPDKIKKEVEFLRDNNLFGRKVILFSDYFLINKEGKVTVEVKIKHEDAERRPEWLLLKGYINGLTLLIPKKAFDEYGDFDVNLICTQDYEMWRKMMKTYRFVHVAKTLVSTRIHEEQTTQTNPKVATEGSELYGRLLLDVPECRMKEIAGSRGGFLLDLAKFHEHTPYKRFSQDCMEKVVGGLAATYDAVQKKKVSVIILFYNRCNSVKRALDSVLRQRHKNIEIILVNDGSDEDVGEIKMMAKKYGAILINNKKNEGVSAARNKGIEVATGDYIAFLDSDDEFEENKILIQLRYMIATNAMISCTSYIKRSKDGDELSTNSELNGYCARVLMQNCPIAISTVMIKSEWLRQRGVLFNTEINIKEDACFLLELMKDDEAYLLNIDEVLSVISTEGELDNRKERQIIALKTIIQYLINDEYYKKFDAELANLMKVYICYVEDVEKTKKYVRTKTKEDILLEERLRVRGSALRKLMIFMKEEGFTMACKRVMVKMKEIISGGEN